MHYNQVNEFMSGYGNVLVPAIGMGATQFVGSDRYMMVVTQVLSNKKVKVAHVLDKHKDKFITDENGVMILPQKYVDEYYEFVPDDYGYCHFFVPTVYTYRKNHRWMPQGKDMWETCSIQIGHADEYRDPSF